jgi:hypothetical protein
VLLALTRWSGTVERQRVAVANAYRQLARLAASDDSASSLPSGTALDDAALTLSSPSLFRIGELSALLTLVDEGRRLRVELTALKGLRSQLARMQATDPVDRSGEAGRQRVSGVLDLVADALAPERARIRRHSEDHAVLTELAAEVTRLTEFADDLLSKPQPKAGGRASEVLRHGVSDHLAALAGQVRAVTAATSDVVTARRQLAEAAGSGSAAPLLALQTDELVDAIDTLAALLTAGHRA